MALFSFLTTPIIALYIMAFFDCLMHTSIEFILLLYYNHVGFTTPEDNTFYISMFALTYAVPVIINIPISKLAVKYGVRRTLTVCYAITSFGMFLLLLSRLSRFIYILGHCCYAMFWSLRIVRISFVATLVHTSHRTKAIAFHQFMLPLGAIATPVIWLLAQKWRGYVQFGILTLDRFSVVFFIQILTNVAMAVLAHTILPQDAPSRASTALSSSTAAAASSPSYGTVDTDPEEHQHQHHRSAHPVPKTLQRIFATNSFVLSRLIFFCVLTFLLRAAVGVFQLTFQPILINQFAATDAVVGRAYLISSIFGLFAPLVVAVMTNFMSDASIMLFGVGLMLAGMSMYLPIFGAILQLQIVIGFTLTIKAVIFFTASSTSALSKVLGNQYNHSYAGYMWTTAMLGPALSQMFLSSFALPMFGSWWLGLFTLPVVLSAAAMLVPKFSILLRPMALEEPRQEDVC